MRNIKLHFSIDDSKKNKEFKLKTDKQLTIQKNKNVINKILKNIHGGKQDESFLNFFKKIIYQNNMNNSNKINYMKASESKKYYQQK